MTEIGYVLSSEEHGPRELVDHARLAADAGIGSVAISDHFHPWLDEQGQSPHVWTVIGAIAGRAPLAVCTMVTCPILRNNPVLVAHAAATASLLLDGRFELGVGTGERLNEHVLGDRWPTTTERLAMLEEAVEVMRLLWSGENTSFAGTYYTVEDARLYSVPEVAPLVPMSAFGKHSAEVAARIADGFMSTRPDAVLLQRYRSEGGRGRASAMVKICWGPDAEECTRTAHRLWRSSGLPGPLGQELRLPEDFDSASKLVTPDALAREIVCGPDPERIAELVRKYVDAGFDRVFLHQIGSDQRAFLDFFQHTLISVLADVGAAPDADASTFDRPALVGAALP
jgi:G6PDH family F420-dependent oxidoreductase